MTIDAVYELSGAIVPVVVVQFDQITVAAGAAVELTRPEAAKTDVIA